MSAKSTNKTSVIGENDPTKRALDGHEGEPSLLEEEAAYQSTTAVRNGDANIISSERGENQEGKESEEAGAGEQQQQLLTQQELQAQQQLQAQQELRAQQELQAQQQLQAQLAQRQLQTQQAQRLLAAAANTAIAPVNEEQAAIPLLQTLLNIVSTIPGQNQQQQTTVSTATGHNATAAAFIEGGRTIATEITALPTVQQLEDVPKAIGENQISCSSLPVDLTTAEALALLHKRQEQWVSMDDAKPYKKVYTDAHPHRQYIKADSHQMNDDYKPKKPGRYRYLTPNKAVVHANQTADTAASIGIATYENKTFQHTIFPDPILMDLHGLRFFLTHSGGIIDKDVTVYIRRLFVKQQNLTWCTKKDHGILARIQEHSTLTPAIVGQKGIVCRALTGKGPEHKRNVRCNEEYKLYNALARDGTYESVEEILCTKEYIKGKDEQEYLRCPLCTHLREGESSAVGDFRHHMLYCSDPMIRNAQNTALEILERAIQDFADGCDERCKQVKERTRIIPVMMRALARIEKEEYIIIRNKKLVYESRTNNTAIANIKEWEQIAEHCKDSGKKEQILNYPLAHKLGFISAQPDGELDMECANIADMMYTGAIPKGLDQEVKKYIGRIARKSSKAATATGESDGESSEEECSEDEYSDDESSEDGAEAGQTDNEKEYKETKEKLLAAWTRVTHTAITIAKAKAVMIRERLSQKAAENKKNFTLVDDEEAVQQSQNRGNGVNYEDNEEEGNASSKSARKKIHQCKHERCTISARLYNEERTLVEDEDTKCAKCKGFEVMKAKTKGIEECTEQSRAMRSKLAEALVPVARDNTEKTVKRIKEAVLSFELCTVITRPEEGKRINSNDNMAIRHFANSIAAVSGKTNYTGPLQLPSAQERRKLQTRATKPCRCKDPQARSRTYEGEVSDNQASICEKCIKIIPKKTPKESDQEPGDKSNEVKCIGCLELLEQMAPKQNKKLCKCCVLLALVSCNNIDARYKDELMKAQDTTEKQARKRKVSQFVEKYNPNLGCAKYIPVDKEVTNKEIWRNAYIDLNMDPDKDTKETREEAILKIKEKELGKRNLETKPDKAALINNTRRQIISNNRQGARNSNAIRRQAEQNRIAYFLVGSLVEDVRAGGIYLSADNDLKSLESGKDMNDSCLEAVLKIIIDQYPTVRIVSPHYFNRGRAIGFKQVKNYIPKNAEILIIPIHTGGNSSDRHWSVLLRIQDNLVRTHRFVFIDGLNSDQRFKMISDILRKTDLCSNGDVWMRMKVCQQQGRTCGQVVALYTALALRYITSDLGKSKHALLERIVDRECTVRAWVKLCIAKNKVASLDWIDQLANLNNSTTAHAELNRLMQQPSELSDQHGPIDIISHDENDMDAQEPIDLVSQGVKEEDEEKPFDESLPPLQNSNTDANNTGKVRKKKGKKGKGKRKFENTEENEHPNKRSKIEPSFKVDMSTSKRKKKRKRPRNSSSSMKRTARNII